MNTPNDYDLSGLDDAYTQAKATDNEVPAGRYNVSVQKAEIKPTQKKEPRLSIQMKVLNGEHAGRMLFLGHMLCPADTPDKTANRLGRLKKDLATMGVTITKLSELPAALQKLLDVKLAVRQVVKEDPSKPGEVNRNVYIDKLLDPGTADESGAAGSAAAAKANSLFDDVAHAEPGDAPAADAAPL